MNNIKENIMNSINNNLDKCSISKKQLSEMLNVSQASVSHWCKGDNLPSTELLPLICNIFNITINDLLGLHQVSGITDHEALILAKYKDANETTIDIIDKLLEIQK